MKNNDFILIELAKKGDRIAFEQLLERHYTMIYRVAYRFTGYAEDAQDIAQEVCVGLVHKLASFSGKSSFSTWLYRIVVNSCHDFHKKRGSHRNLENSYIEFEKHIDAENSELKQKRIWLYRSIEKLEKSLKETAILVLTEELSHAQAGEILGCAESTISWRMHEVRKQLKIALGSYYE